MASSEKMNSMLDFAIIEMPQYSEKHQILIILFEPYLLETKYELF